jgi:NADH dehydrogenase
MDIETVTVFGAGGFLGRYVVKALADRGIRVRAAVRDPEGAMQLRPLGDVGQIAIVQANVRHDASILAAVEGADAVINLTGILYQTGHQTFQAVHCDGAGAIARAAKTAGAKRFVHISAIGCEDYSESQYAQSKWDGEQAVREAFPEATVLRPSIMFGPEDGFFNLFGWLSTLSPVLPLVGGGNTRFQPVHVCDVAHAVDLAVNDDGGSVGETYELGGPTVYTFTELMKLVLAQTGRKCLLVPVPFALAKFEAFFLQMAPRPLLTMDQVELLKNDNVVSEDAKGLADLGIPAMSAEAILPKYMGRYRRGGPFGSSATA